MTVARYHYQRRVTRGSWVPRFTKQKRNWRGTDEPAVPTLTSISPTTGVHGGALTTVTATGTGFIDGYSKITVDGLDQTTTWVSATSMTFQVSLAKYSGATTLSVNVRTGPSFSTTPKTFTIT